MLPACMAASEHCCRGGRGVQEIIATICIKKKLLDDVNIEAIIDDFASRNARRYF
jgi:hypothetical protein